MRIFVFAGPNGSGKSTMTDNFIKENALQGLQYINPDIIAKEYFGHIEDYDIRNKKAGALADELRQEAVDKKQDFIFETVLSRENKIEFLNKAKNEGAEVFGCYILTRDPNINLQRVKQREANGGHYVSDDKVVGRYERSLNLLPQFVDVCDFVTLYDNTISPILTLVKNSEFVHVISNNCKEDEWLIKQIVDPMINYGHKIKVLKCVDIDDSKLFNIKTIKNKINTSEEVMSIKK